MASSTDRLVIIGIAGAAGTGKSTISSYLSAQYGFKRFAFADPVKDMMREFYSGLGLSREEIHARLDGDMKEVHDPHLGYKTPRRALQLLGTEWGRGLWGNLWTSHLTHRIERYKTGRIVVDDVRMDNEADALLRRPKALTVILKVHAEGQARRDPPRHASERGLSDRIPWVAVHHNFTIPAMQASVDNIMAIYGVKPIGPWKA